MLQGEDEQLLGENKDRKGEESTRHVDLRKETHKHGGFLVPSEEGLDSQGLCLCLQVLTSASVCMSPSKSWGRMQTHWASGPCLEFEPFSGLPAGCRGRGTSFPTALQHLRQTGWSTDQKDKPVLPVAWDLRPLVQGPGCVQNEVCPHDPAPPSVCFISRAPPSPETPVQVTRGPLPHTTAGPVGRGARQQPSEDRNALEDRFTGRAGSAADLPEVQPE